MRSPSGWVEPGQTPQFAEYTVVLRGVLRVNTKGGSFDVPAGEAIVTQPGEWVQYSTPGPEVRVHRSLRPCLLAGCGPSRRRRIEIESRPRRQRCHVAKAADQYTTERWQTTYN